MAAISFVTILFLGGAQDVIARTLDISVGHVTSILQFSLLLVPPVAWFVTRRSCIALRDRPGPERTERRIPIERTAHGGYVIPEASAEDWMTGGGAAPGHFDDVTATHAVRGPHRSPDAEAVEPDDDVSDVGARPT